MSIPASHTWRFYRAGGLDQVRFETGADIANIDTLDPKLWVALACPVKGLEFDERTLALIDTDGDSRVRIPEIIGAVSFLKDHLRSLDTLVKGDDSLALADINDATPQGRAALASAKRILIYLGKPVADAIRFTDIADQVKIFAGTQFNGDGLITPASAATPEIAAVITDIIACHGSAPDRSGDAGVDKARVDAFFTELKALRDWMGKGGDPAIATLGAGTAAAHAAVKAVRTKVDDYFARCHIAAYDKRALGAVNRAESEYLAIAAKDLTVTAQEISGFPLSLIEPGKALPLVDAVNPAWASAIDTLRAAAVIPAFGPKSALTESEWRELNARLAAYDAWLAAKPAVKASTLAPERALAILASDAEAQIAELLARDLALAEESKGIDAVEKLVRLNRDFIRLLNNFVSFGDFYSQSRPAIFQVGRLYLDSRECHLCIHVEDAGKHAAMAGLSKCYLAYCDLTRKGGAEKKQILAIFSQGDSDYLMVGRNGVFVDRKGRDWDATIAKIIDAPISIRQAFFSPYKKFVRLIEEQVAKRAAAADNDANARLAANADKLANADKHGNPAAPAGEKKIDLGTIALISTAVTGLTAIIGGLLTGFFSLGWLMPVGVIGLILAISGPSMLIAALKLRQRNLGPILDANGWAMNGRVKVNIPLGTSLTDAANLPENSTLSLDDPFAEKRALWPKILGTVAIILLLGATATYAMWRFNFTPFDNFVKNTLGMPSLVHKSQAEIDAEAKINAELELATKARKALELENRQDKAKLEIEKQQIEKAKAEADKAKAEAEKAKAGTAAAK